MTQRLRQRQLDFGRLRAVTAAMLVMWDRGFHDFDMFDGVRQQTGLAHTDLADAPLTKGVKPRSGRTQCGRTARRGARRAPVGVRDKGWTPSAPGRSVVQARTLCEGTSMVQYGVVLFHTTSAALRAEKLLQRAGLTVKLIPTPPRVLQ